MKSTAKKIVLSILVIMILIKGFVFCLAHQQESIDKMHPISQPGTVWISTDGAMTFTVEASGNVMLDAETEHGIIELEMNMWQVSSEVSLYEVSDENSEEQPDRWFASGNGSARGKNKYALNIQYVSPTDPVLYELFEPGDVIVFRKTSTIAD